MATVTERHPGGAKRTLKRSPIGLKIEALAAKRRLHLDEVAAAAGISFPTLHRICTGKIKSPKLQTVRAIATALGVKLETIAS